MSPEDTLARRRFMVLNIIRLSGLGMILIALAIHYGRIEAPQIVAYVLAAFGVIEFFFVPNILARKWRSPRP